MQGVQVYILPCLLALLGAGLTLALIRSTALSRRPLQFGQATVVATGQEGKASFELFDGQIIELTVAPERLRALHVGDYGRLSYYGDSRLLVTWQKSAPKA